jgi:phage repressor protein C with HTH and peptisase S24 domain
MMCVTHSVYREGMATHAILRGQQAARLRQAREAKGFKTPTEALAKHPSWKQSTYLAHENGQNGLTAAMALTYADAFDVEPGWLLTGVGNGPGAVRPEPEIVTDRFAPNAIPAPPLDSTISASMPRDVPVRGIAEGGPDGTFFFDADSRPIDWVKRPPRLAGVPDAYALYVQGDSMKPWRENRDLVYAVPRLPVKIMDYVALQLRSEEHPAAGLIKRLVKMTERDLHLEQYNPPKILVIPRKRVVIVDKILDWSELMGI